MIVWLSGFRVCLLGVAFVVCADCGTLGCAFVERDFIPEWRVGGSRCGSLMARCASGTCWHVESWTGCRICVWEHVLDVLGIEASDEGWIAAVRDANEGVQKVENILRVGAAGLIMDVRRNCGLEGGGVCRVVGEVLEWLVPKGVRWRILKGSHDDVGHCGSGGAL